MWGSIETNGGLLWVAKVQGINFLAEELMVASAAYSELFFQFRVAYYSLLKYLQVV